MATLGSIDLGIVKKESVNKSGNLFFMPLPKQDSNKAITIDLFGVQRTITISAEFIGEPSTIKSKILQLDALHNGKQTGLTYNGETITNKKVYIQDLTWDYDEGEPTRIKYILTLIEGK